MSDRSFIVPEVLVTNLHLRPGDKVGDFGSGAGNFTAALSRAVGSPGKVYACEIQRNLVESLIDRVAKERLSNVEVVWSDLEAPNGTKLESGALDAGVAINMLFQAEDRAAVLSEIARTLRPGGKFFLVDWTESWGGLGPQPGLVLTESNAKALAEAAGLTFERSFSAGDHHYGLAFRK